MGSMHDNILTGTCDLLVTRYKEVWEVPGVQADAGEEQTTSSKKQTSLKKVLLEKATCANRPPAVSRPNSVTKRKQTTQRCPSVFARAPRAEDRSQVALADDSFLAEDMTAGASFSKLDLGTIHRLGWTQEGSDANGQHTFRDEEDSIYKLTKVEFRRLSEQVRDVSMNLKNRFRSSHCSTKLYSTGRPGGGGVGGGVVGGGGSGDNLNQVYHSQLAASLKAFQNKTWRPLKRDDFVPTVTRCRPISSRAERRLAPTRPSSAARTSQRPHSVPPGAFRPSSGIRPPDTLEVGQGDFDHLSPGVLASLLGRDNTINNNTFGDRHPTAYRKIRTNEDDASTSGIDSPNSDEEGSSSDNDSEPSLDRNRTVPHLQLRPEKLDSIYVPDDRKDRRRFDFDAEHVDIPAYEFDTAVPEPFSRLDLKVIARQKYNWRDILSVQPKEKLVETLLDRMVEIERLQWDTVDVETRRLKQRTKQRVQSAKSRDRRCCSNCLQPACVGDCPEKVLNPNTCTLCRERICVGVCEDTNYDAFMRKIPIDEQIDKILNSPVPRVCLTCQKRHNAKFINANNAVLRRPKSGNTTYCRGQKSAKPRDLRPRSVVDVTNEIIRDIEKLGLEATQPPRPITGKLQRPRSRNGMLPGKSYFSNRKDSLTDLDRARKRKLRTLRVKRPKSVV